MFDQLLSEWLICWNQVLFFLWGTWHSSHSTVPYELRRYLFGSIYCNWGIALIDNFSSSFWIILLYHTFLTIPYIYFTSFPKQTTNFCLPIKAKHLLHFPSKIGIAEVRWEAHHVTVCFSWGCSSGMRFGSKDMIFIASILNDHS